MHFDSAGRLHIGRWMIEYEPRNLDHLDHDARARYRVWPFYIFDYKLPDH